MMTRLLPLIVVLTTTASRAQLSLEAMGEPFDARGIELVWQVPTSEVPQAVAILKVLPASFSPEVVSNVIGLCGFKEPGKVWDHFKPVAKGKTVSYKEPHLGKPVLGKNLQISPANGSINFLDPSASSLPRTPVLGVPTEQEALARAVELRPKLGLRESDLAHKRDGSELDHFNIVQQIGRIDREQKKLVETPTVRGVILVRQVNGISFSGAGDFGGLRVEFGNEGRIKELALTWRNLQPDKTNAVANPEQILQFIRKGLAVIRWPQEANVVLPIHKITFTHLRPYYYGSGGDEPKRIVLSYAMLTALAETGNTSHPITLSCPLLK